MLPATPIPQSLQFFEVHTRTHPAATLSPEARAEIDAELAEEADELAEGDAAL
jgi:hypothetical protein